MPGQVRRATSRERHEDGDPLALRCVAFAPDFVVEADKSSGPTEHLPKISRHTGTSPPHASCLHAAVRTRRLVHYLSRLFSGC